MESRVLAVIPVRGGSTRVKRKNIREVDGKPLVAHAIEDAKEATHIDTTVVSTNDEEIRSVAEEHGGTVPFRRPDELATDEAPTAPVITHALDWFENQGETFDIVCLVQATVPLRKPQDIDNSLEQLINSDGESVITVTEFGDPPQWSVVEDEDGFLTEFFDFEALWGDTKRSQDLERLHFPNGAFFASFVNIWRETKTFYTDKTIGYEMPQKRSVDIDEPWELELVRALASQEVL